MTNKIYLQIIAIPVIFILITSLSSEFYNMYELNDLKEKEIEKATNQFIKNNKHSVYDNVHQVVRGIEFSKNNALKNLRIELKTKVDSITSVLDHVYEHHKFGHSSKDLKNELLKIVKSHNKKGSSDYFFIIDMKSSIALVNNVKELEGKPLKGKKDLNGVDIYDSKIELLKNKTASFHEYYFEKPNQPNKQFKKIVYFKKFEKFDWIIGTGKYVVDYEAKVKREVVSKLNTLQKGLNDYVFISHIHNINGGKDFATMLVLPNKPELIGKRISDDRKDIKGKYHRKEYLEGIRKNGETYVEYYYKKVGTKEEGKKLSYFYYYEPWDWMIGSGFYFDDLEDEIVLTKKNINKKIKEKLFNSFVFTIVILVLAIIIFIIFAQNITDQLKSFISKIETQSSNFEKLFNNSPDGILLLKNRKIVDSNNSILKIFSFGTESSLIGHKLCDISPNLQPDGLSSKDDIKSFIIECERKGSVNFEWEFKRSNGEIFEAEVTLTKINLDSGEIIHAVIKDISQKKKLELDAQQKDAIMIQQSKMASMGEMIGNIAHQWRQPLNALSLTVQKIKFYHDTGKLTDEILDKSVDKSKMLITKMSTTIDDFRNFFKVDKVKVEFDIKKDAIDKTVALLEESLKNKAINLNSQEVQEGIRYFGLKNELEQVLLNIINNAKDALVDNQIKEPYINISTYENDTSIFIRVCDNAGGIPEEIMDKIFEPYFTTKEQGKGTGIGLYMSRMIVQTNMGGTIEVSNTDVGACFVIVLDKKEVDFG